MIKKLILFQIVIGFILCSGQLFSQETDHLKVSVFYSKDSYSIKDTVKIAVLLDINSKYHIQSWKPKDENFIKTEITSEGNAYKISGIVYPPDKAYKLESNEEINVYGDETLIGVILTPDKNSSGLNEMKLRLNYQACDDKVCFPPKMVDISLKIDVKETTGKEIASSQKILSKIDFSKPNFIPTLNIQESTEEIKKDSANINQTSDTDSSDYFENKGLLLTILLIFIGGLALNLTPCVYPLIPITISFFGGMSYGQENTKLSKGKSIIMGVFYALGMSATYSSLGLFAALTGSLFGNALQNPIVIVIVALVFIALSLSMFGLYEIRIPQKLAIAANQNRAGYLGAFIMGLLVGFIAAPCIGPFVLSLLVYVGKLGNPFYGFLLFFVLSMGLGFPYIILAAFSSSLNKLPRSGEWMIGVKLIFGFILIGMAINTLGPIIPAEIFSIVFPVYIIGAGLYMIVFDNKGLNSKGYTKFKYLLAIAAIVYGTWILKPDKATAEVEWQTASSLEEIQKIIETNKKPVIIDFYADWCAACKELDKFTYTNKEVSELAKSFTTIKLDFTQSDEKKEAIKEKYNIKGLPVVVFMTADGKELKEIRLTGFEEPEDFIKRMQKTLK